MNSAISFPALVIGKSIDRINYHYLVADRRMIHLAYRDVLLIDQEGNCFEMEGIRQEGGLSIYYSIVLVGKMVRVAPVIKKAIYHLPLDLVKDLLISWIQTHPNRLSAIADDQDIINDIHVSRTYLELIKSF
jgi:hypothetical protein